MAMDFANGQIGLSMMASGKSVLKRAKGYSSMQMAPNILESSKKIYPME